MRRAGRVIFFTCSRLGEAEMANCNSAQVFSLQGKVEKV